MVNTNGISSNVNLIRISFAAYAKSVVQRSASMCNDQNNANPKNKRLFLMFCQYALKEPSNRTFNSNSMVANDKITLLDGNPIANALIPKKWKLS